MLTSIEKLINVQISQKRIKKSKHAHVLSEYLLTTYPFILNIIRSSDTQTAGLTYGSKLFGVRVNFFQK